jgi:hypothetical protein
VKQPSLIFLLVLAIGCSSSVHEIKVRAQSPRIEEAFRKLALAVTADGYEIDIANAESFALETKWKELTVKEVSSGNGYKSGKTVYAKLKILVARRGHFFDVIISPTLRYTEAETTQDVLPELKHPLILKWTRILNTLVQRIEPEED